MCRAFGLAIRSELPVPGATVMDADDPLCSKGVDLEILEGSAALHGPCVQSGPYRYAGDTLLFERQGTARYLCSSGARIVVEPFPGAFEFDVCAVLIATAIPAALWMRGDIVMHAAAVVLPGSTRAFAIGGVSGSGKSTVLSQLIASGARVVGDDTLCLRLHGDSVQVSGLAAAYFLSEAQAEVHQERAIHAVPEKQQQASAELAAFAVLSLPRATDDFAFEKLEGIVALQALLASRHRPRVPQLLRAHGGLLAKFGELARLIPTYSWSRRASLKTLDADELTFLAAASALSNNIRGVSNP